MKDLLMNVLFKILYLVMFSPTFIVIDALITGDINHMNWITVFLYLLISFLGTIVVRGFEIIWKDKL